MRTALASQPKGQKKPFIVDVPAKMLQRHAQLSKGARGLYLAMRSIANGKTGELAIRGNPLGWEYICKKAEISRCTWLKYRKELLAAGFLRYERDRISIYRKGRKLAVFGRARYFVVRQPGQGQNTKKSLFLLKSNSSTVEELDPQIFSETPRGGDAKALEGSVFEFRVGDARKKSSSPATDDDFSRVSSLDPKDGVPITAGNPFLPEEEQLLIRNVRVNLARDHAAIWNTYPDLKTVSDDWFCCAMAFVESRGTARISSPLPYFTAAIANLLESGIDDDTDIRTINEMAGRKAALREKYMRDFPASLIPEQEAARRKFNEITSGKDS